ncbi:helix-turn-helix domain-containing protein [Flavonifractor plautii]|uniref:helix-turn-helix domain-containing protein n=1 Tax=Flavonifractor plautii TaxID=292800 RepID=UPI001D08A6DF|nr:helix-turn-helix domain-containing protein [Flavonifractor plautii]
MNSFRGDRLRKLREAKKIKRYILSQRCGLHSDAIRRYERGEAEPDLESMVAIADFFEVSLDYLAGRVDFR